jgi:hypothetical protein
MSKSHKPRRPYDPLKAGRDAIKGTFQAIWNDHFEPIDPPTTLYHYCAPEVFMEILQSRNLWASDILRMNDCREVEYAVTDIIGPLAAECENGHSKYFVGAVAAPDQIRNIWGTGKWCTHIACFSSTADLPSQWHCYAKGCTGVAIGFNFAALYECCRKFVATLFPVMYDANLQTKLSRKILENEKQLEQRRCATSLRKTPLHDALRAEARGSLGLLLPAFKDPKRDTEREWRLLIIQRHDKSRFTRHTRGEGIGYFELPIIMPNVVKEIVCGPKCEIDITEIRSLLTDAGLNGAEIRRAECECDEPLSPCE